MSPGALQISFADKLVVVTGAAGAQGMEEARVFAELGASVVMVDLREFDALSDEGCRATAVQADISTEAGWQDVVAVVEQIRQPVDVLVNNAGLLDGKRLSRSTYDDWRRVLDVNLVGPALGTAALQPYMKAPGGLIVNIGSVAAFGSFWSAAYTVSKWGLRGLTAVTVSEYAHADLRAITVHPGVVETEMNSLDQPVVSAFAELSPAARPASAREIAEAVAALSSDVFRYVNGADFVIDGGFLASVGFDSVRARARRNSALLDGQVHPEGSQR